jgi:hypothetical protein
LFKAIKDELALVGMAGAHYAPVNNREAEGFGVARE